ncbi:MAG: hypothetical protein IPI67_12870 [Myxococcales bacterium]|nr:hypothetical protein [Myxococcales bacterium]
MSLSDDVDTLLLAIFEREQERESKGEPRCYFESRELAAALSWTPERFNRAGELLEQRGPVEVDESGGSTPFFTHGLFLTPAGWLEAEQLRATQASKDSARSVESGGVSPSLRDKLRSLADELRAVESYPWANVEVLIQRGKPLVRTAFPDHVDEFAKVCTTPKWAFFGRVVSGGDPWTGTPRRDNFAEAEAGEKKQNIQLAAQARNRIVAFLDGLLEIPEPAHDPPATQKTPLELVIGILERFPAVARALATRSQKREPLTISDEYDVQYILGALLAAHFDDVRAEEWTPSYAGKSSRMDFLLKRERIVVETKYARSGHADKEIADELIIDKERYKKHGDCDVLVCFVNDPSHVIRNPVGLEDDLAQESGPKCEVVVRPR